MRTKDVKEQLRLYTETATRMKPGQIVYRLRRYAGLPCTIGCRVREYTEAVNPIAAIPELDLSPEFLARFSVDDLMQDRFTFLHASHHVQTDESWEVKEETPLWNFNLHYFEYLFPLWNAYWRTGDKRYLDKAVALIVNWIRQNPRSGKGTGWAAYTIDLRVANWLSFYTLAEQDLPGELKRMMAASLYEQYAFLSTHVEKDILGNHYFEDLKALVLCAIFFRDGKMFRRAVHELRKECREEILPDGMHFELSPMYHNLIFEGLLKVTTALKGCGRSDQELESFLQPMLDVAWSLEESLERIPLFNDAGNNISKSLDALVYAAGIHFELRPAYRNQLPDAGYYIFRRGDWKLIVDAGQPGPSYIPGHAHCDALSFELYRKGKPAAVNCGTFAYQSELRDFFRGTSAHNTVKINDIEQSRCWGYFRMAGRSSVRVLSADEQQLITEMTDQAGQRVRRTFLLDEDLVVTDETNGGYLTGYFHPLMPLRSEFSCEQRREFSHPYAPEYGRYTDINAVEYAGRDRISLRIPLDNETEEQRDG